MRSFEHINATTVGEAVSALAYYNGRATAMAGGTDLLAILKDRILPDYPAAIINIKAIPDMEYIRDDAGVLSIGALTKLADIAESEHVRSAWMGLAQAAGSVATPEIRNMGTIGGNLCQQVRCWYYRYPHQLGGRVMCRRKGDRICPAVKGDNRYHAIMGAKGCFAVCPSDLAVMLTALGAKLTIAGPEGERSLAVEELFDTMGTTLEAHEILTEVRIPRPLGRGRQRYLKHTLRKPIDFAVVGVASIITVERGVCTDASIVLGAVAPTPVRAVEAEARIKGHTIDEITAERAAEAAVKGARPMAMNAYKTEIAKNLVKRAILSS